jgi:RimJ/RimL family protein N-acetyltransferase
MKRKSVFLEEFRLNFLKTTPYLDWLNNHENIMYIGRKDLNYKNLKIKYKIVIKYLLNIIKSKNDFLFLIRDNNKVPIGTIKIGHIDWYHKRGDLGILIDQKYQGRGYGAEAVSLLIKYSFKILKLNKITGGCLKKNISMRRIFLKNKFRQEGSHKNHTKVNNKFLDHVSYGLLKKDIL